MVHHHIQLLNLIVLSPRNFDFVTILLFESLLLFFSPFRSE